MAGKERPGTGDDKPTGPPSGMLLQGVPVEQRKERVRKLFAEIGLADLEQSPCASDAFNSAMSFATMS